LGLQVVELLKAGADAAFQRDSDGASALMLAAKNGHCTVLSLLLEDGAPWNAIDKQGHCAGDYAVNAEQTEAAELLLEAGPSPAPPLQMGSSLP
jgi:type IV protein arginine methyltransferase